MNAKTFITNRLKKTEREGIEDLLNYMDKYGFYDAPCSGKYHLCKKGGLAEHTVNVITYAEKLWDCLCKGEDHTSVVIAAALHDLGKMGQFGKPNYVDNVLKSGRISDTQPYTTNKELLSVDHEIRSVAIAQMFIDLTEEEQFAILYHNGMYGNLKYSYNGKETPLSLVIHWADMWCARVIEEEKGEE